MNNCMIVGAGVMGSGIAYEVAKVGYKVVLVDKNLTQLGKSQKVIFELVQKEVSKKIIDEAKKEIILNNIIFLEELEGYNPNIIIEAVFEDVDVKKRLLSELDHIYGEEVIIASNTSVISITELASVVNKPGRVIGTHFFNPVNRMPLVEVINGYRTTEEITNRVMSFINSLNKTPILVPNDTPGFIVNRLLTPYILEAIELYSEGIKAEDIDKAMKLGAGFPMGPLELADLIGLDVLLKAVDNLYSELKGNKFVAPVILRQMVRANCLGRKTESGFYNYYN